MKTLLLAIILVVAGSAVALPDKTTRTGLRPVQKPAESPIRDTVAVSADSVLDIVGYDKPLRSRKESLFITNRSGRHLEKAELLLNYRDMEGRQLHQVTRWVECDIPAGETRQVTFPSWDTQLSFYYHLSRPPRSGSVTPFDVTCRPLRLILSTP